MVTLLLLFSSGFSREMIKCLCLFFLLYLRKERLQKQLDFLAIFYCWLLAEFYGECQLKGNLNFTNQGVQLEVTQLV